VLFLNTFVLIQHYGTIGLLFLDRFMQPVSVSFALMCSEEDKNQIENVNNSCSKNEPKGVAQYS